MGIAVSVLLIAVGAVLAFAVNATVAGLDIEVVGWILMGVGLLGLVLTLVVGLSRRRTVVGEPAAYERVVERPVVRDDDVL